MVKKSPLEDIQIVRQHRKEVQRKIQAEKQESLKEAQERRDALVKERAFRSEATQVAPEKFEKKKPVRTRKKPINLNEILSVVDHGVPFSAEDVAKKLGLDFSKGSTDRSRLAMSFKKLQNTGLIEENNGRFLKPFEKKIETDKALTGVVRKHNGKNVFVSTNPDIPHMDVPACHVTDGTLVTVIPTSDFNNAVRIVAEHGNLDEETALSKLTALDMGIPIEFPQDVLDETIGMTVPEAVAGRRDYTNKKFIAIDPETAKDKDDAFYVTKTSKGWRIMVAVADVAHYVRPGTKLWDEALKRGNSTYLPGLTIPMLPPVLSNGLCSLHQGEVRAAKVTTIDINKDGNIIKHKVESALIRCHASLNYDEVQGAIGGKATGKIKELYNKYIVKAQKAVEVLMSEAEKRGRLDLNVSEQRIDYSADTGFSLTEERNTLSHEIIAYLMISNNRTIPNELEVLQKPIISRAHAEPSQKAYDRYLPELEKLGVEVNEEMPLAERIRDMAHQSHKDKKNGVKIRQILIRIQDRAKYTVGRAIHYGLGLKDGYSHFTSPIRRFSDLISHSMLSNHETHNPTFFSEDSLKEVTKHLNKTERRSEEAERQVKTRAIADWLSGNMGTIFNARVIGIDRESQELELRVEGRSIHTYITVPNAADYRDNQKVQIMPRQADKITGVIAFKFASNDNVNNQTDRSEEPQQLLQGRSGGKSPRIKPTRYRHCA